MMKYEIHQNLYLLVAAPNSPKIYRRVMLNEAHRSQYAKRVLFEREFGSSIDPNMYEDMDALEWEFTGRREF